MEIYQGEPLGGKINIKEDEQYLPSLEGITFQAILVNPHGRTIRKWSTEDGTITIGTETIATQTIGYAVFSMSGAETSELYAGSYTLEIARVLPSGKAIGVESAAVVVKSSNIGREI